MKDDPETTRTQPERIRGQIWKERSRYAELLHWLRKLHDQPMMTRSIQLQILGSSQATQLR